MGSIWDVLQIEATTDQKKIKRAYAARSREIHPEESPQEFQVLYQAYQAALRYASIGGGVTKQEGAPEATREEADRSFLEEQSNYDILGEVSEALKKQWSGMGEIKYFQSFFNRQLFFWTRSGEFLDHTWVDYLQSERFQKIMWSPVVMETIASGISRYFQGAQHIMLFFWKLYGMDIYEKWGEDSFDREGLQALYRSLFPVSKEGLLQQRIKDINVFLENWENQRIAWRGGKGFQKEWFAYMRSESFAGIMWTDTVLETITAEMRDTFPNHEAAALFFWDLYGFEKLGEKNCKGKSLELYRVLYPSYIYRLRRAEYERNKGNKNKRNRNKDNTTDGRIKGIMIFCACILLLYAVVFSVKTDMRVAMILAMVAMIFLLVYAIAKWISSWL